MKELFKLAKGPLRESQHIQDLESNGGGGIFPFRGIKDESKVEEIPRALGLYKAK